MTAVVSSRADRFLRACRREAVDTTPVWLMRQAGRYMSEYRALRERHGFLDLVRTPELAAEITLQPVRAFEVDAAIVFADILPLLGALGLEIAFEPGDGPSVRHPIRAPSDVDRLGARPVAEAVGFTLHAVREARRRLAGQVPLIGFSGAPFTLACYAIEGRGVPGFPSARSFLREHPGAGRKLLERLACAVGDYLREQVGAGAQALQLFDSWAGTLDEAEYRELAAPHAAEAIRRANGAVERVPLIHFAARNGGILEAMRDAGGDVIGVDSQVDLAGAWRRLGEGVAVQGNLDPDRLLDAAPVFEDAAARILDGVRGRPGHIFNLGHGVRKDTPPEHVDRLVRFVHAHGRGAGGTVGGRVP